MPVFDFLHWTSETGDYLDSEGPLIQVEIGLPQALEDFCVKGGIQVPSPVAGYALIDTGASATAASEQLLLGLGIQPIDSIPTHTPHGDGRSFVYPTKVSFPGVGLTNIPMNRIIGCDVNWKAKDGKDVVMLLGRDLLKYFMMVYHGPGSRITLAY